MKNRLLALALCLVMTLGLAAPSFAVQADAPGGLDGAEPDLWDILAPDAPGGLDSEEPSLPAPDEPAQLDEPEEDLPEETPDLTQIGENAPAESCLYCGAAGDVHADFCPLYVPAESGDTDEPAPVLPADAETPAVPLETVLSQTPAQAVRTLSIDQPGVLTESQRFSAFTRLNQALFAENDEENGENDGKLVDNDGIYTDKKVEDNNNGTYTVTIESYVTGQTVTTETAAPADIILVLDMSGQMKKADLDAMQAAANKFIELASSEQGERRIALVTYQNTTGKVISGTKTADEDALVKVTKGTNGGAQALTAAVNALLASDLKGDAYCQYGLARATQIFQSYTSDTPRYVILLSAGVFGKEDAKLTGDESECAAQVAINVSTVLKTAQGTKPNVKWGESFYNPIAMDQSATTKNLGSDHVIKFDKGCGAVVYCVGLNMPIQQIKGTAFRGDPYFEYSEGTRVENTRTNTMAGYGNTAARINEAMYRICSDRPDSSHVTPASINYDNSWEVKAFPDTDGSTTYYFYNDQSRNWETTTCPRDGWVWSDEANTYVQGRILVHWDGTYPDWATRNQEKGHFLTGDTTTIEGRFKTIFENIQSSTSQATVTLDKTTILTDVVTKYFEVPKDADDISVEVWDMFPTPHRDEDFSDPLTVTPTVDEETGTTSVTVTGFDYSEYFVDEKEQTGKKLVLTFTIQPKAGFLGGEGVPTNVLDESGVFTGGEDSKLMENLPNPGTQNVPLKEITLTVPDKSIYLSQMLDEAGLLAGAKVMLEDETVLPLTEEAQKNDWRFDYVDLSLTVTKPNTWETCALFLARATLSSGSESSLAEATPTVHVFRPTVNVTANDVWADYGVEIDLKTWCVTQKETTWAHYCGEDAEKPSGNAPEISISDYTFDLVDENDLYTLITNGRYLTTEDDVNCVIRALTYTVGEKSYSTGLSSNVTYPVNGTHFTIHINHFDLKVSKSWAGADCYKQSAIFTLSTRDDKAMTMQFTLSPETGKASSSTTVHGLVCGKDYTLSEVMDWSWRYNSNPSGTVKVEKHNEISKTAPTIASAEVSFTNSLNKNRWFDAADIKHNQFKGA